MIDINANKGMYLEKVIDQTVAFYYEKPYFFFMKYHTKNAITKTKKFLFIENKFVDYFGFYKQHFFVIEAKQNATDRFSFNRLTPKQWFTLNKLYSMNVKTYVLLYFAKHNEFYLLDFGVLLDYKDDNKKCIKYLDAKEKGFLLTLILPGILNIKSVFDRIFYSTLPL